MLQSRVATQPHSCNTTSSIGLINVLDAICTDLGLMHLFTFLGFSAAFGWTSHHMCAGYYNLRWS